MIKKAMILAAGFGKRVRPLTLNCPKPLLKIGDQTLLSNTINFLEKFGIKAVAISSYDAVKYPEDSFENMIKFSKKHNLTFPYLFDKNQNVAKSYNAVCTPDFFGFNGNLELQYRGRIRELKDLQPVRVGESDLFNAMKKIAETGKGPKEQIPSLGCSIKWLDS